ncbi:MAG TPA: ATP-binding protein [Thermodesulfobacteriota bacterium]|nr:ATP-binding protein [Thermodesulfobacteriota bacterium]
MKNDPHHGKHRRNTLSPIAVPEPGSRNPGGITSTTTDVPGAGMKEYEQIATVQPFSTGKNSADVSLLEEQMQRCDKMAMVGELAAGLAHEIGTPLTVIQGTAEYLLMDLDEADPRRQDFETILSQANRITQLMDRLLTFSRSSRPEKKPLDINHLIGRVLALMDHHICKYNCQMSTDFEENIPPLAGDGNQLTHAFLNILLNAIQSLPGSGSVFIRTRNKKDEGGWIEVTIADTGCGISDENAERIFDPFFTTEPGGKSTGLGLTASLRIIRNHGGVITVGSTVNHGSVVTTKLPIMKDGTSACEQQ